MNNTDRVRIVTTEDLIRRYNLDNLKTDRIKINNLYSGLQNQYNIIKKFVQNVAIYTDQTDSTVWFYNGLPDITKEPFVGYIDLNKVNIYYDRDSGKAYILENSTWTEIEDDSELLNSLSIASSEPDTGDNKRNIFYTTPYPKYQVGDVWINDTNLMRCRCSRDGDSYNEVEWVYQNEYSDTGIMLDVRAVLDVLKTDYVTTSRLETTKNTIEAEVTSKLAGVAGNNGYVTAASIVLAVNGSTASVKINADKIDISATDVLNILSGNALNLTSNNITITTTSGNFSVTAAGQITATSGTIGGFDISSNKLSWGNATGYYGAIVKTTSTTGGNYALAIGAQNHNSYSSAIFRVTKTGFMTTQNARIISYLEVKNTDTDLNDSVYLTSNTQNRLTLYTNQSFNTYADIQARSIYNSYGVIYHMLRGHTSITPSAPNTPTGVAVTFEKAFGGTPRVIISNEGVVPGTTVLGVSVSGRSSTGFTAWATRTNTTDTGTEWLAIY